MRRALLSVVGAVCLSCLVIAVVACGTQEMRVEAGGFRITLRGEWHAESGSSSDHGVYASADEKETFEVSLVTGEGQHSVGGRLRLLVSVADSQRFAAGSTGNPVLTVIRYGTTAGRPSAEFRGSDLPANKWIHCLMLSTVEGVWIFSYASADLDFGMANKRVQSILASLSLAEPVTAVPGKMTAESLEPIVREHAFVTNPELNPLTVFDIKEYEVASLWDTLQIQLFGVQYGIEDGGAYQWSADELLIYHDGQVESFASAGPGVMSAVVVNDALYYSYSYGSGIHRSCVGRLSMDSRQIAIAETSEYPFVDLFVSASGGHIQVSLGWYSAFNDWDQEAVVGTVEVRGATLAIVDSTGQEVDGSDLLPEIYLDPSL